MIPPTSSVLCAGKVRALQCLQPIRKAQSKSWSLPPDSFTAIFQEAVTRLQDVPLILLVDIIIPVLSGSCI